MRRTKAQIEADEAQAMPAVAPEIPAIVIDARAQDMALRIWNGQSPDLLRHDRIERVARGLEAQGMSMDNVVLPA